MFSPRGEEPLQGIERLFRLRNRLVHASRHEWKSDRTGEPAHYGSYNPEQATRLLMTTLDATYVLEQQSGRSVDDGIENVSLDHLKTVLAVAQTVTAFPLPTEEELKVAREALRTEPSD